MNTANSQAHYNNGLQAKSNSEYGRAIDEFRLAVDVDPDNADAHKELGWLTYGINGSLIEACNHLESALCLNAQLGDAHMYLGIVLNRLSKLGESEAHFRIALEQSEDPAIVHSTFAEDFLWHKGRYGEAEQHFLEALRLCPEMTLALRDYARMLSCHGRDDEAQNLFQRALDIDPKNRHTKRAYEEFMREKESDDRNPDECLRAAVKKDPSYVGGIAALNNRSI